MIFSDEEVAEINRYQNAGIYHPWNGHGKLIATNEGLVCPECDYVQTWVHGWIKDGSWDVRR